MTLASNTKTMMMTTIIVKKNKSKNLCIVYQNQNQKYLFGHIPDPGDLC